MSSFCLDTSAYSNFRRGNEEVAALLDRAELVGMPTVALGELRTGFLLGGRRRRDEAELDAFLDSPVVQVLPVDSETSRHYAEIVAELRKAGTPIPTNDIWIAATAARNGATVLTCDDHFERIGRVGSVVIGRLMPFRSEIRAPPRSARRGSSCVRLGASLSDSGPF